MKSFNDYLKEAALSAKQKKIAKIAGDKDKIDAADLAALRNGKKPVDEASCSGKDMKKEELVGNQHKLDKNKNGKLDAHDFKLLRKEDTEQIDELKASTLTSYVKKAAASLDKSHNSANKAYKKYDDTGDDKDIASGDKAHATYNKRHAGMSTALKSLSKKANDSALGEETELDEATQHEASHMDSADHVYANSDSPGHEDRKDYKEHMKKHFNVITKFHDNGDTVEHHGSHKDIAAVKKHIDHLNKQHGSVSSGTDFSGHETHNVNESAEQIDEISKDTLKSYIPKAAKSSRIHGMISTDYKNRSDRVRKPGLKKALANLSQKYKSKAWSREDMIGKAVNKLTKEDVQIDEGKMKELSMDLKDMSHDEFHKQYGKPKSHFDPTNFKKPVEPGKGMDRAKALAQRGMQSLSKEEVEQIEEKAAQLGYSATRKDFQMVAKLIKGHESAEKRKELATHHAGIFAKQNPRFDHAKFMKAAGVNEEVEQEMSPYLKATLQVMDEAKIDDLRDAQKLRAATKSAYDKDYKADTSHPSITVNKGTAYGGAAQKDDVNSDENPIKKYDHGERGRPAGYKTGAGGYIHGKGKAGRPHGSKSGARLKGSKKDDDESGGIPTHTLHLPNSNK